MFHRPTFQAFFFFYSFYSSQLSRDIQLPRPYLGVCPAASSASQQMKAVFPSITRGLFSKAVVLQGAGHAPSFCLRHMHSHVLSPRERILPPGFRTFGDGSPAQGFLLYSWQLILFQRDWEPKETAKSTFTWPKSKSHQQILRPLPPGGGIGSHPKSLTQKAE